MEDDGTEDLDLQGRGSITGVHDVTAPALALALAERRASANNEYLSSHCHKLVGPLAIRCLYDWDPRRVVALIRAHIRLGVHPDSWKVARGVAIPKTGKDDYSAAKAYRIISSTAWGR